MRLSETAGHTNSRESIRSAGRIYTLDARPVGASDRYVAAVVERLLERAPRSPGSLIAFSPFAPGPVPAPARNAPSPIAAGFEYFEDNVAFTSHKNPSSDEKVWSTAEASYPLWTMQLAHFGLPDSVPYFSHSVACISSSNVSA